MNFIILWAEVLGSLLEGIDSVCAENKALHSDVATLREALVFYSNSDRYAYDSDCCPESNNPGYRDHEEGVMCDDGERARSALAALTTRRGE